MQRRSQPSPSPSSEDAEKGRCCGMENWGVTASEIEHLAVVGAGEFGIQHQLSSNGTVRTKLRQKSTPGVGVIHQRLTSCVPPTHSWLPTWAPSCYLIMLRWIDLATIVKFGTLSLLPGFTWVSRVPDLDPNVSELRVAIDRRHSHFGLAVETRKANLVRRNGGIVVSQWLHAVDMEIKPLFKIIEQGEKIQNLPRAADSDSTGRPSVLCRLMRFCLRLRSLATIVENVYAVTTDEEPRTRVAEAVELLSRCGVEDGGRIAYEV